MLCLGVESHLIGIEANLLEKFAGIRIITGSEFFPQIADKTDTSKGLFGTQRSRFQIIFMDSGQSLIEGLIFGGLIHFRITVPFVDVHGQKVASADIDADPILGQEGESTVVFAPFYDGKIAIALFKIAGVSVKSGSEITVQSDR